VTVFSNNITYFPVIFFRVDVQLRLSWLVYYGVCLSVRVGARACVCVTGSTPAFGQQQQQQTSSLFGGGNTGSTFGSSNTSLFGGGTTGNTTSGFGGKTNSNFSFGGILFDSTTLFKDL